MRLYKNATAVIGDELVKTDLLTDQHKILKIAPQISAVAEVIDLSGKFVLPALIDEHTHGANGFDFNTARLEDMHQIMNFYLAHGVGSVFPTVMTDDFDTMQRQLAVIAKLSTCYKEVKGIHLEGPFLAENYAGAMPKKYLQPADVSTFDKLQQSAEGKIKIVTLSAELPNCQTLVKELVKRNITVNVGHSGADYETTQRLVDLGVSGFTHTFNRMAPIDRLSPNVTAVALESDCFAEIICDGMHVHPALVRLLVKTKGIDKVIGVTDSMMATGLGDGIFTLAGQSVTVQNGNAFLSGTTTRAGSLLTADECLANFVEFTHVPLAKAVKVMTENPAKHTGIFDQTGSLAEGKDADFFILG